MSSIVAAELYTWAYLQDDPTRILTAVETLLDNEVELLAYDQMCAEAFGKLRGELVPKGINISPMDLLIASVARAHNLTLVTHNVADFAAIPALRIVDWLAS